MILSKKKINNKRLTSILPMLMAILGILSIYLDFEESLFGIEFTHPELLNPIDLFLKNRYVSYGLRNIRHLIHIIFFFLLLLGGIRYNLLRKSKNLLRFVLCIVFLNNVLDLFVPVLNLLLHIPTIIRENIEVSWGLFGLSILINIIWAYFSLRVIRYLSSKKTALFQTYNTTGGEVTHSYIQKSNGARILHLLFDPIFFVLIYLKFIIFIIMKLNSSESVSYLIIYGLSFIFYAICYSLSEYFFGATPIKFLTKSLVTDTNGEPPSLKKIIIRTLIRFIPFEAFSFFTNKNWHDTWSDTWVIQEVDKQDVI